MKQSRPLVIRTREREFTVPEGKPVIVQWKSKNKSRPGRSVGIGWIRRGEKPHTIELIHSAFQTWDQIEKEYPARWTIWETQVLEIHQLQSVR